MFYTLNELERKGNESEELCRWAVDTILTLATDSMGLNYYENSNADRLQFLAMTGFGFLFLKCNYDSETVHEIVRKVISLDPSGISLLRIIAEPSFPFMASEYFYHSTINYIIKETLLKLRTSPLPNWFDGKMLINVAENLIKIGKTEYLNAIIDIATLLWKKYQDKICCRYPAHYHPVDVINPTDILDHLKFNAIQSKENTTLLKF